MEDDEWVDGFFDSIEKLIDQTPFELLREHISESAKFLMVGEFRDWRFNPGSFSESSTTFTFSTSSLYLPPHLRLNYLRQSHGQSGRYPTKKHWNSLWLNEGRDGNGDVKMSDAGPDPDPDVRVFSVGPSNSMEREESSGKADDCIQPGNPARKVQEWCKRRDLGGLPPWFVIYRFLIWTRTMLNYMNWAPNSGPKPGSPPPKATFFRLHHHGRSRFLIHQSPQVNGCCLLSYPRIRPNSRGRNCNDWPRAFSPPSILMLNISNLQKHTLIKSSLYNMLTWQSHWFFERMSTWYNIFMIIMLSF